MTLGYDEPVPSKEDYDLFFEVMSRYPNLLVYGSYARQTHKPGKSDIDAVLVTDDEGVIDYDYLQLLYQEAQEHTFGTVPFQANLIDKFMAKDGRFLGFDSAYKENFIAEGKTSNKQFLDNITFIDYKSQELSSYAHTLRKMRLNFLQAKFFQEHDYSKYVKAFSSAVFASTTMAKKILVLSDTVDYEKNNAYSNATETFPELDHSAFEKASWYQNNLPLLFDLYRKKDDSFALWKDVVGYVEQISTHYLKNNPKKTITSSVIVG